MVKSASILIAPLIVFASASDSVFVFYTIFNRILCCAIKWQYFENQSFLAISRFSFEMCCNSFCFSEMLNFSFSIFKREFSQFSLDSILVKISRNIERCLSKSVTYFLLPNRNSMFHFSSFQILLATELGYVGVGDNFEILGPI